MDLRVLSKKDLNEFIELIRVFEEVFEMKDFVIPNENHLQRLLSKEDFFAIVASEDNRIIGGLTLYVLQQYYSVKPLAYIYDLAVLNNYQRQGVGRKLISFTTQFCHEKGVEEVFVQADRVDDYALDFYRKTNPTTEEDVIHFTYFLKDS